MTIEISITDYHTIISCLWERQAGRISEAHKSEAYKKQAERVIEKIRDQAEDQM